MFAKKLYSLRLILLEDRIIVKKWKKEGLATDIRYKNNAFLENNNTDKTIDFILDNLK